MHKGQANGRPMELEPHLTLYLQENTNSYITLLTNLYYTYMYNAYLRST